MSRPHQIGAVTEPVTELVTEDPGSVTHSSPAARDRARTQQAVIAARLLEEMRAFAALIREQGDALLPLTVIADVEAISHAERVIRGAMLAYLRLPPVVPGRLDEVHG